MARKPVKLEFGKVYTHRNPAVGSFRCLANLRFAVLQNTVSGWMFTAHGVGMYEDGTIDWDYSTKGHFAPPPDPLPQ